MGSKTTSRICSVGIVLTTLLTASSAFAYSGFTKSQGEVYGKLAYVRSVSNQFYGLTGMLNDRGEDLTQQALNLYAEAGVWRGLQFGLNVPILRANAYANTGTAAGIGDITLEAKYGLSLGGFHVGFALAPELPTGRDEAEVETDTGLAVVLPTGDGEFNLWSRLGVSYGFYSSRVPWIQAWVSAGAGYNLRTQGYSDQIGWGADLGVMGWGTLMLTGRIRGQVVPSDDIAFAGFIYGEGTEYATVGAGAAIMVPRTPLGVTVDWDRPIAAQKNLYGGNIWSIGMSAALDLKPNR